MSYRRKPVSSHFKKLMGHWTPVFTGVTTFYKTIILRGFVSRKDAKPQRKEVSDSFAAFLGAFAALAPGAYETCTQRL